MSAELLWPLQEAVVQALQDALWEEADEIPIFDHIPDSMPPEHIRIDGFAMDAANFKNAPRGTHKFMVHYFQQGTRSRMRVKTQLAKLVVHLQRADLLGKPLTLEYIETSPGEDQSAHAMARFSIVL